MRGGRGAWPAVMWCVVTAPLVWLFALSVPAVYARKLDPAPAVRAGLEQLGLSTAWYATWWSGVLVGFALVCFGVAGLIVWRRPRERAAWFAALVLVSMGAVNAPNMEALVWQRPALAAVATIAFQFFLACLVLFLFTFPDGRFRPRWSWPVVAVAVAGLAVARGSLANPITDALFGALMFALVAGIAAQIYRYRRVSTPEQRRQTRWVSAGMAVAVVVQLVVPALETVPVFARPGAGAALFDMAGPAVISIGYSLVVIALAVALLRTQLWGIEVVVNRAAVYGVLTVVLLALYTGVVAGLGRSIGAPGNAGGSLFGAAVVALVFAPLRDRIQRGVNRLMYGHRDEPYAVLSDLSHRLEDTLAPAAMLQTIVERIAVALKSPYVAITVERDAGPEIAAAAGAPAATVDLPLTHRRQPVGTLQVAPRSPSETFSAADRALLDDLARQAGAALHAVNLTEELQRSRERLVTAREEERRRLRRDLHDGLGPALASMTLQAEAAAELIADQPDVAVSILSDLVGQLQSSTADIRRLVYDLRPPALDDLGLTEALRASLLRSQPSGLQLTVDLPEPMPQLSAAAEVAIYRIVHEAVLNVQRHARASACTVTMRIAEDSVVVEIADNGIGVVDATEGVGLRSMRERADELGGTCSVTGSAGAGTLVRVSLPRSAPAPVSG